ncbi:hypothetical protein BRYFOR_06863 [Marvinbryantia formatexigens DSM 14469]|uniref:Uncharacterized protein n=1 Tax=Marvinbryantia formatexigens DSM 14469 TaxID=478749 RepID=C6LE14_9FIRM|nr:hypothetical protein BRYFOR_06863 [Marvinbryantia formatexigens DSM 14469]
MQFIFFFSFFLQIIIDFSYYFRYTIKDRVFLCRAFSYFFSTYSFSFLIFPFFPELYFVL